MRYGRTREQYNTLRSSRSKNGFALFIIELLEIFVLIFLMWAFHDNFSITALKNLYYLTCSSWTPSVFVFLNQFQNVQIVPLCFCIHLTCYICITFYKYSSHSQLWAAHKCGAGGSLWRTNHSSLCIWKVVKSSRVDDSHHLTAQTINLRQASMSQRQLNSTSREAPHFPQHLYLLQPGSTVRLLAPAPRWTKWS